MSSSPRPHLERAPIVEAILDIRVRFEAPPAVSRLEAFHEAIKDRYPVKVGAIAWESELELSLEGLKHSARQGPVGFMFRDKEARRSVQARQDGFTFNWLRPYETWEALRDEAREHWERYRNTFHPDGVTRIALRYINRLELPLPIPDFREYVRTVPDIAPGLPQGLRAFFMRLEIPEDRLGLLAIITETMESPGADRLPFIFDIDVIRESAFPPDAREIWDTFENLRDFKNDIFFKSITEKTVELYR